MRQIFILLRILFVTTIVFSASCNIDFPDRKELIVSEKIDEEINHVITLSNGILPVDYTLFPSVFVHIFNGEKEVIHSVRYSSYHENLDKYESPEIDSFSSMLAKVILKNTVNDTSFSKIVIEMNKVESSPFHEKEWNYSKEFNINEMIF